MSPAFAGVEPRLFRKKRNLMLAYGSEVASPLLRVAAAMRVRGKPAPREEWRRGLILSHTHLGDVLFRTCSLPALREYLPNCEWTYAVSQASAPILENNPHLAEILPIIDGENSWNLVKGGFGTLKRKKFDVVLCSNTLRHYPDLALAVSLGIPNRFGFSGKGFSGLINNPVAMAFPDTYAGYFRKMVGAAVDQQPDWPLRPRVYPSETDRQKADEIWSRFGFNTHNPVVACALTTRQPVGSWPRDVLISIVEQARRKQEFSVVICGSPDDAAELNAIARSLSFPARVFAGEGGILTFASLLEKCAALLTQDSGPRHIGNAVRTPVLFARNLYQYKAETGRYCDTETDIAPDTERLSSEETERVVRSFAVEPLADVLLRKISVSRRRASPDAEPTRASTMGSPGGATPL